MLEVNYSSRLLLSSFGFFLLLKAPMETWPNVLGLQ